MPGLAGHEPVGVEGVFLQPEPGEAALQVSGPVAAHPMPQDQVLRSRRRADRVRLHEAELAHGLREAGGREQRRQPRPRPKPVQGGVIRHAHE